MIKFLDLKSQYNSIKTEIDQAISNVIDDTAFVGGRYVERFEAQFADYINVDHCVTVGNGTDALEISIEALDLPDGSEIIVPANSFIASAEAVSRNRHQVVFADVNPDTHVIDVEHIKSKISKNTKAIVAVHLYGHPCHMASIMDLANNYNIKVIEDCAQAHGATFSGSNVGSLGHVSAFSFYPGKNLGAYGDGGAITTNNTQLAQKCRMIANHGRISKYNHEFVGRNSRLDGMQAAILSVKLNHLEKWTEHRIQIANHYKNSLSNLHQIILPTTAAWARHVYHLFVIKVNARDELQQHLNEKGIETGVHYPIALPSLKAYANSKNDCANLVAVENDRLLLSLPIGDHITIDSADNVIHAIQDFFSAAN